MKQPGKLGSMKALQSHTYLGLWHSHTLVCWSVSTSQMINFSWVWQKNIISRGQIHDQQTPNGRFLGKTHHWNESGTVMASDYIIQNDGFISLCERGIRGHSPAPSRGPVSYRPKQRTMKQDCVYHLDRHWR